jgi:UDP-GlcNAc:undecaprenyl-phosphate GlcNAc-1-phosphate transferase
MIPSALTAVLVAGAACCGLTALMRILAPRFGLLCRPDALRRLHARPIPLGGGLAVYLATAGVLGLMLAVPNPWRGLLWETHRELLALLLAAGAIVGVGLLDDRFGLSGRTKLAGQLIAASIAVAGGFCVDHVALLGVRVELGLLAVPFSLFWMLGSINALNLLDGMDGLATTTGIILAGALAAIAAVAGQPSMAIVALVFVGALAGFACFNLPPATIFLGDTGSMLIGLMLAALAVRGSVEKVGTVSLVAAMAVLTIPILDSAAAVVRRKLTGRSLYAADRGHIHHCLQQRWGSTLKALAGVAACCLATSAAALAGVRLHNDLPAIFISLGVVTLLAAKGLFGRAECLLVFNKAKALVQASSQRGRNPEGGTREEFIRLQGTREWTHLWTAITKCASELDLQRIRLNISLPMVHEACTATWEKVGGIDRSQCWRFEIPLTIGEHSIGCLSVSGHRGDGADAVSIEPLLSLLQPMEAHLRAVVEAGQADATGTPHADLRLPSTTPLVFAPQLQPEMVRAER